MIESEFCVGLRNGDKIELVGRDLENTKDARRWIKNNGEEGQEYQILALKGDSIEVEVDVIRRRTLFEHTEKEDE